MTKGALNCLHDEREDAYDAMVYDLFEAGFPQNGLFFQPASNPTWLVFLVSAYFSAGGFLF